MRIRYAPYRLEESTRSLKREGALLEFTFEDDSVGYADCHPWPELGDEPLERQLSLLREGRLTPLSTRSLDFAIFDAAARSQKKNLFSEISIPKSHYLLTNTHIPENFRCFKCKDPQLCLQILPLLKDDQKIRMDFNFKLSSGQFIEFFCRIKSYIHHFDYIEDPFPYNSCQWKHFEKQCLVSFALDRFNALENYPIRIIKPAVDSIFSTDSKTRRIYTSYLDHPFGQVCAAYTASKSGTQEICGLASHLVYKKNAFSERLSILDETLSIPIEGYGFGFDDLLFNQHWRLL